MNLRRLLAKGLSKLQRLASGFSRSVGTTFRLSNNPARLSPRGSIGASLNLLLQSEWMTIGMTRLSDAIAFHKYRIMNTETEEEVTSGPVVDRFRNPNPTQTWAEFLEELLWYWIPSGNNFTWMRPSQVPGVPAELWNLRPDRMEIKADPVAGVTGYVFTKEDGKKEPFATEEIRHTRFANPYSKLYGLGKMQLVARTIAMDIAAAEYAAGYFESGADPGAILSSEKEISDKVFNRLREEWLERHQGYQKNNRTAILEGGIKYEKAAGATPQEAQFLETRKTTRETIHGVLGVPPIKAGYVEGSNRANAFIQERSWQRDTIAPLLKRLEASLTIIAKTFGPYEFKFEELVQEDQVEDVAIAQGYFGMAGLSPNDVRELYAGLPRVDDPNMDKYYLPVGVLEIGADQPPVGFSVDAGNRPAAAPAESNGKGRKQETPAQPPAVTPRDPERGRRRGTPVQRRLARFFQRERLHQQRVFRLKIARWFREQGEIVAKRIIFGPTATALYQAKALGVEDPWFSSIVEKALTDAFDPVQDEKAWRFLTRGLFGDALEEQFTLTAKITNLDVRLPFEPGSPQYERAFASLSAKMTRPTETTRQELIRTLEEGLQLGLGPTDIANGNADLNYPGVRGTFEGFAQERSQLIARTESARVMDKANVNVYKQLGVRLCDVIGCEDSVIMAGQKWGCNSQGVPVDEAEAIEFHPNHKGHIVPRLERKSLHPAGVLTRLNSVCQGRAKTHQESLTEAATA